METQNPFENRVVRPVRIGLPNWTLDGFLNLSLGGRTLDELNVSARPFLTLTNPRVQRGTWELADGPAVINKASILFVLEIPDIGAVLNRTPEDPELRRFNRAAVRMLVGNFQVEGFVHVGTGGHSLLRLNQSAHPFIALQSAGVKGPETEFGTAFLAINRPQIVWTQELYSVNLVAEEAATGT